MLTFLAIGSTTCGGVVAILKSVIAVDTVHVNQIKSDKSENQSNRRSEYWMKSKSSQNFSTKFQQKEKGLVIVYTGEGKGKTTAALGLALRAVGYKKKVFIIQFGKAAFSGEVESIKKLKPYVKLMQGGKGFVGIKGDKFPFEEHKKAAQKAFERLYQEVMSKKWDVIIADEITGAVVTKLLSLESVLQLIQNKPAKLDLVLTGHYANQKIIKLADLVTEMKSIKHPFEKGILAKKGIDY